MKTRYLQLSNRLILDKDLQPSRKKIYLALLAMQRRRQVNKTYAELAAVSGCSVGTVRQSVADLAATGYISVFHNYRYGETSQDILRDTNLYIIEQQDFSNGYTLVPCKLLKLQITHAAFLVALYLLKLIGMNKRAWPSLRKGFEADLGLARSTICAAIRQLVECKALVHLRCLKANRAFTMSTFILQLWGEGIIEQANTGAAQDTEFSPEPIHNEGGSIFDKHRVINKITSWFLLAEKRVLSFDIWKSFLKRTGRLAKKCRPPTVDTG